MGHDVELYTTFGHASMHGNLDPGIPQHFTLLNVTASETILRPAIYDWSNVLFPSYEGRECTSTLQFPSEHVGARSSRSILPVANVKLKLSLRVAILCAFLTQPLAFLAVSFVSHSHRLDVSPMFISTSLVVISSISCKSWRWNHWPNSCMQSSRAPGIRVE